MLASNPVPDEPVPDSCLLPMTGPVPVPIGPDTLLGIEIVSPAGQRASVHLVARTPNSVGGDAALDDAALDDKTGLTLTGETASFAVTVRLGPATPDTGRRDLRITLRHRGIEPVEASVRVQLYLPQVPDPWWLIPGLFYGENRPVGCGRVFPRFAAGVNDADGLISDHWEFRADRSATPAVFAWGEQGGAALLTTETSTVGLSGLGLQHDADAATASIALTFPYAEAPVSYDGSAVALPAMTSSYRWQPGEEVRLDCAAYPLSPDRHGYAPILAETHRRWSAQAPVKPWVSIGQAADLAAFGLLRWHYDPDPGVLLETAGFDRGIGCPDGRPVDRQAMHVGWVSGLPWAYALLVHGRRTDRDEEVRAAAKVIDFCCANLSPSGTFWGVWYRGRGWSQSWSEIPNGLHARTLGEATLFLVRALQLLRPPSWVAAARANLDAVANRQRADGNVGSIHHALSGEVLSWQGASGLTWVSALAEAGGLALSRPHSGGLDPDGRYLAAAERAGDYYARFVESEFICGAPEDVDLAPTSEDGYAAVMAYLSLYRRTGARRWLELARRSADWMLTFRYTYNVAFEPHTLLGTYRFASRGADQASPANQHLHAYGLICTAELIELSAALGDPSYADRALETLACFRQFVARQDGDFNAYRGMVSERYYQTACFQPKGMLLSLSHAWSVGVLLLACEQMLGPVSSVIR